MKESELTGKLKRVRKIINNRVAHETESLKLVNVKLTETYDSLHRKNKEVLSSIQYAKLIHQAILPKERHFKRAFTDSFIFYKPKDIIGGDFYWVAEQGTKSFIALADCTGHGVPGALLSVLGHSLLNYIVLGKGIYNPKEILQELDTRIIDSFHMTNDEKFNNDWMDITLCCYDRKTGVLEFAGARHSLFLIKNKVLVQYPGNKFPVAGWQVERERNFTEHNIQVETDDIFYLFTDGYPDQFGGPKEKKFTKKQLKKLLLTVSDKPMQKQKLLLSSRFKKWKGKCEQTDDVCLIGIKF